MLGLFLALEYLSYYAFNGRLHGSKPGAVAQIHVKVGAICYAGIANGFLCGFHGDFFRRGFETFWTIREEEKNVHFF